MPILPLLIFLVSLGLRLWDITHPINVDEALWMFRGATFMRRLLEGDFAKTYLRHHPGVTNMWVIGTGNLLSSGINDLFPRLLDVTKNPFSHPCFHEYSCPISLWIAPRVVQGLITSACMVAVYVLSKKLFGRAIALLATGLLIVEPFFLAYQRFLTTDALQADFSILAVLLIMLYLQGRGYWWQLVGSGICLGLAIASKIPALFIGVAICIWIVAIELGWWRGSFPRRGWLKQIRDISLWGLIALAVIVAIWPALWVNPVETIQELYADLSFESIRGNFFFLGEYTDRPGLLFYPLILIYRLSPVLQLGIIACLLALVLPKSQLKYKSELWGLTIVTAVVLSLLSTSDTKVGRYIVVVIPELAILAAFGYSQIFRWCIGFGDRLKSSQTNQIFQGNQDPKFRQLSLFLIAIQAVFLIFLSPYYISFYNPVWGGAAMGQKLFLIGNGEGIDRAAEWLNQDPDYESLKVASWYGFAFKPYSKTQYVGGWTSEDKGKINILKSNRLIFYINQLQRKQPTEELVDYFAAQKPLKTITFSGLDYAKIYPGLEPLPSDLTNLAYPVDLEFGDRLKLIGYDLNQEQFQPKNRLEITFYWDFLQPLPPQSELKITLKNGDNQIVQTRQVKPVNGHIPVEQIPAKSQLRDVQQLQLDSNLKPGKYNLVVNWINENSESLRFNETNIGDNQEQLIGKIKIVDAKPSKS